VIMRKLEIPDVERELEQIYKKVAAKIARYGEMADEQIEEIVQEHRRKKRGSS